MNKRQARIAWIVVILLSFFSVLIGYDAEGGGNILFTLIVPTLLIGGLAFYRAKEKGEKKKDIDEKKENGD